MLTMSSKPTKVAGKTSHSKKPSKQASARQVSSKKASSAKQVASIIESNQYYQPMVSEEDPLTFEPTLLASDGNSSEGSDSERADKTQGTQGAQVDEGDSTGSVIAMLDYFFRDSETGANLVETLGYAIHCFSDKFDEHIRLMKERNQLLKERNQLMKEHNQLLKRRT